MQKVIRRAALAANQAKRKARIQAQRDRRDEIRKYFQERQRYQRSILDQVHAERKSRREDWLKGPLAPKRDVANLDGAYGTLPPERIRPPALPREDRVKYVNFAPGDRVVILKGRERGKIGKIYDVNAESGTVSVGGVNSVDVRYPDFILAGESDKRPFRPISLPFRFEDVRLVVPLHNSETGKVEDVVVKHMYGGEPYIDHPYGVETPKHTRYISDLDVEIPWPEPTAPDHADEAVDTLRIDVEDRTHIPSVNAYPFPVTIIDELRNKFSKFRTRHDPEWVAQKEEEDRKMEERRNRVWVTPKTEFMAQKVQKRLMEREQQKDENGNYIIPQHTASYIEQFLAKKQNQLASKLSS
ncbi:KOW domain-containing protein domain-containing protein [Histoplasma capsulatum var. duboisii H88]|uniref:KOW domain-containing protein domain-containing protein n=2 Tax=Ajellomyces capsulatus TaxID=5037 RepID=F0U5L7_AJEC8|nr:KOW domain-containing protein [Histoplasma capsulatum H143]EGC42154.1 KOW domain-containing protein domain-containing protein [Histoplasma capsulatum var. duboisii H88]QSS51422.1 KOW domain-containing protein domain-containing protein [Histoplasma capsulatum var. duboisii H88]